MNAAAERAGLNARRRETAPIAHAAHCTCHPETISATLAIDSIPQLFEDDAIALLHAVEAAIRRSGNTHLDRWKTLADELAGHQLWLQDEIEADRAWRGAA